MDKETKDILSEGRAIQELLKHEGWGRAENKLKDMILDLQNINNLDFDNVEKMAIDARSRRMAAETLYGWLKDLHGTAEQYESNKEMVKEDKGHIKRI